MIQSLIDLPTHHKRNKKRSLPQVNTTYEKLRIITILLAICEQITFTLHTNLDLSTACKGIQAKTVASCDNA